MDKTSTTYFMTQMTQQEFDELIKKYRPPSSVRMECETGLTRKERYIFNKIRSDIIHNMDEMK